MWWYQPQPGAYTPSFRRQFAGIVFFAAIMLAIAAYLLATIRARPSAYPDSPATTNQHDSRAYWRAANEAGASPVAEGVLSAGTTFILLADLNDDGRVDQADLAAKDAGVPEFARPANTIPNGLSAYHDQIDCLDDDLEAVHLEYAGSDATLHWRNPVDGVEWFASDWLCDRPEVVWPLALSERTRTLWLRFAPELAGREITLALDLRVDGNVVGEDTLTFRVVGALGDPYYFAAAHDFLNEPIRRGIDPPKLFLDEVDCRAAGLGGYERFKIAILPHDRTRMKVAETYYDKPFWSARDKNIEQVAAAHPGYTLIINGNYFHGEQSRPNHGRRTLGAVIHDGELSSATGRHTWPTAHREAGLPPDQDWQFDSYALVQWQSECGGISFVEEEPQGMEPFIPKRDGALPDMALGGLHTVHTFENNVGNNKSHIWIAEVPSPSGGTPAKLIGVAMTMPEESTAKFGGPALRKKLRRSGLVVEEYSANGATPPGRSDIRYLDGGTSVAMAYTLNGQTYIPIAAPRHNADYQTTRVNNYLAFRVGDCP